tara:strand:- start:15 stop:1121 length:1107 start_codon:yes stop_codon:yes gene_type:complete
MSEEIKETAGGELTQGEFKIKKQVKKLTKKDIPVKVVLDKVEKPEDEVTKVDLQKENKTEEATKEVVEDVIVEITESSTEPETKKEPTIEKTRRVVELPEDLNKLVEFMQETGGTVKDYVRLDTDFSSVDDNVLLKEYYKSTKPHLNDEEINFIMEDNFSFDEELDEERDIKKKKLAMKEEIANAKNFLEDTKDKYYKEIKLKSNVTEDQQKAMDFFNRYNEEEQHVRKQQQEFASITNKYFSNDFKGFEFNVGEKKFKYNVGNAEEVAKDQLKLTDFTKMFLNEDGSIADHEGYHKALYAARNADTIAKHFYEQGKSDGIKNIVNKSKNIETASRPQNGEVFIGGMKVKAISGVDSSKLKIQTKNKN